MNSESVNHARAFAIAAHGEQTYGDRPWRERKFATNSKFACVSGIDEVALIVKAADRPANLRVSMHGESSSKLVMYRLEHPAFRDASSVAGYAIRLGSK